MMRDDAAGGAGGALDVVCSDEEDIFPPRNYSDRISMIQEEFMRMRRFFCR
jgi:hypothetical protein